MTPEHQKHICAPTAEDVANYLFHSFRHSQGDDTSQKVIHRWYALQHPYIPSSEIFKMEVVHRACLPAEKYTGGLVHAQVGSEAVEKEVESQFHKLLLCRGSGYTVGEIVRSATINLISRDWHWLIGTIENEESKNMAKKRRESRISFTVRYALENKPTGSAEINDLYRLVGERINFILLYQNRISYPLLDSQYTALLEVLNFVEHGR